MKILWLLLLCFMVVSRALSQTVVPYIDGGPMGAGSWLLFNSGEGTTTSIQENWGLNICGALNRPVKIVNTSLLVGYHSGGDTFGLNNVYVSGNLGLGTNTSDGYKFKVNGNVNFSNATDGTLSSVFNDGGASLALPNGGLKGSYGAPADKYPLRLYEALGWNFTLQNIINTPGEGGYSAFRIKTAAATNWNDGILFQVRADGNVGIGVSNPSDKLSVNGNIRAREIKVENTNWPDYVFSSAHVKLSLKELETFISSNKHLPEIPSAKEIEKEGVNLSEMNAKLLKKIEELTLYIIEINKKVEGLQLKNIELEKIVKGE